MPGESSFNEPIYALLKVDVDGIQLLQVSILEDIRVEKLQTFFRQMIRNGSQCYDQLDIAVNLREHPELNHAEVAEYLLRETAA